MENILNPITKTEVLVLNAASDDYENLEQIYRSLVLEFSPDNYDPLKTNFFGWREAADAPSLSKLADAIKLLTNKGLLAGRTENGMPIAIPFDSSVVWQGWFRTTELGLKITQAADDHQKGHS